ncbi:melanoma-associated antigen B10 [Pteropus alecto]|uniref:Melanoma-associated antigen B10 n=1 Tax=Pteropus alecto TaxID=9402 RepID=L5L3A0_PTEAL|nr:melanoma-associated antigen B10 [Pteropus alecto]ELK18122.1 Melanoma-associated antigen B10 [Pteropus alecto]
MPRGLKSKLRAREKRRQAQEESTDSVGAQEEEESPSSPSSGFRDVPQDSSAKVTPRNPRVPGGVCSTTTTDAAVSNARFNKDASNQEEERENSSQAQDNTEQWYRGAIDEKVVMLVHYLLYKYQMKEPITKADMMRNVIQVYRSHFHEILRKASDHLELIFGLDVKEIDPNRNTYVLINKLELNCDERDNRGMPMTGPLMTILGVIFTKGNCATEEEVWEVLNMMELFAGKKSLIYGDPKKLITEDFVQQQYLEYRQVPGSDPPCFEFLWGPRAHVETSKMRVLEFLAKIYNTVPSAFPSWYKEALQDQEESARARAAAKSCTIAMARARSKALASRFSHTK